MVKQKHENVLKFRNLITSKNKTGLIKLCKFIKIIETGICVTHMQRNYKKMKANIFEATYDYY
jgi:hypothetical protein